jgi:hypothetical protein
MQAFSFVAAMQGQKQRQAVACLLWPFWPDFERSTDTIWQKN